MGRREDDAAILSIVRGLIDAWNACDPERFAASFAPSADYLTGLGERVHGRAGIADLVRHAASGSPVSMIGQPAIEYEGQRAARVRFNWAAASPGKEKREGIITCALTREGPRWAIQALRNEETS